MKYKINILKMIDHTLLKPDATRQQIKEICDEAKEYGFFGVCVNPFYVGYAAEQLIESTVAPCCVVGFPLGAATPEAKAFETEAAIATGAKEVDMVINIGAVKSGEWVIVQKDIKGVVNASRGRAIVKVILETCLLSDEEKIQVCKLSKEAGADFVKTSTGFSKAGATLADVRLMRKTVGPDMGIKASGGIRDLNTALAMIKAGATRIGTSAGVEIANALKDR